RNMERPAKEALEAFYRQEYDKKVSQAEAEKAMTPPLLATLPADTFITKLKEVAPKLELPQAETLRGKMLHLPVHFFAAGFIRAAQGATVQIDQSLVSLAPLETITIFFMVGLVSGLVMSSPWVF